MLLQIQLFKKEKDKEQELITRNSARWILTKSDFKIIFFKFWIWGHICSA